MEDGRLTTFVPHQLFSDVAYKARDREDLIAGIDEFLNEVIVLPPGEWDPKIRIEPPKKVLSADKRLELHHLRWQQPGRRGHQPLSLPPPAGNLCFP